MSDFNAKCTTFDFHIYYFIFATFIRDPLDAPNPLAAFKVSTSKEGKGGGEGNGLSLIHI